MNSLHAFWHATVIFSERLTAVRPGTLALAIGFSVANLVLRSLAWRNILQAAYPQGRVRRRSILAAYLAGVGTNAVVPARGGDVMKVFLAHRSMPGAAYTTITSSLVAETLVDVVIGPAILIAAYLDGRVPHLPVLGHLATWEWTFLLDNGRTFALLLAALLIGLGVFFTYIERRVSSVWSRIKDGFAILRSPRDYVRRVVSLQVAGWGFRAAAMYWFLQAFSIPSSVLDAVLALSAASAATLLPLTPGGLGPQQALLGYMFRNAAPAAVVLSFSVGMQFAISVTYMVLGGIAIWVTLRRVPWRLRTPPAAEPEASA